MRFSVDGRSRMGYLVRMAAKLISDVLRRALADYQGAHAEIARQAGIDGASLSRFLNGQRGLSLANADALARHLGLELVQKTNGGKKS